MPHSLEAAFAELLDSAARLQELVPDAVLVGGTAAALHAHHPVSFDHDHVLANLRSRFDTVLEALEREGDWVTNRTAYGKIILGDLGGIETGVRQLIRARPLEVEEHLLPKGSRLIIPTLDETLRIKGFLIVKRNQTRDYLDVAALSDLAGFERAAATLSAIDAYYADQAPEQGTVAAQLAAQLADPRPKDSRTIRRLDQYKGLAERWQNWTQVAAACQRVTDVMLS